MKIKKTAINASFFQLHGIQGSPDAVSSTDLKDSSFPRLLFLSPPGRHAQALSLKNRQVPSQNAPAGRSRKKYDKQSKGAMSMQAMQSQNLDNGVYKYYNCKA